MKEKYKMLLNWETEIIVDNDDEVIDIQSRLNDQGITLSFQAWDMITKFVSEKRNEEKETT